MENVNPASLNSEIRSGVLGTKPALGESNTTMDPTTPTPAVKGDAAASSGANAQQAGLVSGTISAIGGAAGAVSGGMFGLFSKMKNTVSPGKAASNEDVWAGSCFVADDLLAQGVSGVETNFTIVACDEAGDQVGSQVFSGASGFEVKFSGPGNLKPVMDRLGEGELSGKFTPVAAGSYTVMATFNGQHIKGSPGNLIVVPGPASGGRSLLHTPPLVHAGKRSANSVTVICHDQNGNVTRGGDDVVLELDCGPQGVSIVPVEDNGNGTYMGHLDVRKAGMCTLTVLVNEELIGVPTTLSVAPGPAMLMATCSGTKLECTAGEPATLVVQSTDASGNSLSKGGAEVIATIMCAPTDEGNHLHIDGEVFDNGNGTYRVSYSVPRTGEYEACVRVVGGSKPLNLPGLCLPSATAARHCKVLESKERIVAGQSGMLRIQRCDALGNVLRTGTGEVPFVARGEGGGPMTVDVAEVEDGVVEVTYEARIAGDYMLTVTDAITAEVIPGLPLAVEVRAGPVAVASCNATVMGAEETPSGGHGMVAGEEVTVVMHARDIYGNTAPWRDRHKVEVVALGPQSVAFTEVSRVDDTCAFKGTVTASGSYVLSACVGGLTGPSALSPKVDSRWAKQASNSPIKKDPKAGPRPASKTPKPSTTTRTPSAKKTIGGALSSSAGPKTPRTPSSRRAREDGSVPVPSFPSQSIKSPTKSNPELSSIPGWPHLLQVHPTDTVPDRTVAAGTAFSGLVCWEPAPFVVSTADRFGNHRVSGGDSISVTVTPKGEPEERNAGETETKDNGDGSYTALVKVDMKGKYHIAIEVNGVEVPELGKTVEAVYGPVMAKDCALSTPPPSALCGTTLEMSVEPIEREAGRRMTGREAVSIKVVSPSGASRRTEGSIMEDLVGYTASLPWLEAGLHRVHCYLGDDEVAGSGFTVDVLPLDACLEHCEVRGGGLETCIAGSPAEFLIKSCDERGNRLGAGGAGFVISARCGAELVPGEVRDSGNGNYVGVYTVTAAGPYDLVVSLGDKSNVYHGVCHPSGPSIERCEVEDFKGELAAGAPGILRVRLADSYGNIHESATGSVPFTARTSGPGAMAVKAVECADGTVAVQYEAEVAGSYHLHLEDAASGATVPNSPWTVRVLPGPMVASACVARVDVGGVPEATSPSGRPLSEDAGRVPSAVPAGEDVMVHVEAKDKFGNTTAMMDGQRFWVEARGPEDIVFEDIQGEEVADHDSEGAPRATFRGTVAAAGSYVLSVAVGGRGTTGMIKEPRTPGRSTTPGGSSRPSTPGRDSRPTTPTTPRRAGTASRPTTPGRDSRPTTPSRSALTPGRERPTTPGGRPTTPSKSVSINTRTPSRTTTPTRRAIIPPADEPSYAAPKARRRPTALKAVKGWPRVLQCVAGPSHGPQCTVHGDALAGVTCWDNHLLVVSTADEYGNARTEGGDVIGVKMQGPQEMAHGTGSVQDNKDGTYTLTFAVGEPGDWWLNVSVNGMNVLGENGKCVRAKFGPLEAKDCELAHTAEETNCGESTLLVVQPRERGLGRKFTGREGCTVKVVTPAGISRRVTARMIEKGESKGMSYTSKLTWLEAGKHTVWVALGEKQVPGSPFTVTAHAQAADLQMCEVQGPRLTSCTAGETAAFLIQSRDSLGNLISKGGAEFLLKAKPLARGGEPSDGEVLDKGDGSYVASYTVSKAGSYELELKMGGAACIYTGQCLAGPAFGPNCSILSSEMEATAGTAGVIRVQQFDKLGNKLTLSTGDVPLQASGSGPGPLEVRVVEVGDGTVNIEYKSTVAGQYAVEVTDSVGGDPLPGSPIQVTVLPGPMAVESVVATVEGLTEESEEGIGHGVAGEALTVKVEARDRYGNATAILRGQGFWVEATGPATVILEEQVPPKPEPGRVSLEPSEKPPKGTATFKGEIRMAGSYMLAVGVGERGGRGSPGTMSVASGFSYRSGRSAASGASRGSLASLRSSASGASRASRGSAGSATSTGTAVSRATSLGGLSRSSLTSTSLRRRERRHGRSKPHALKSIAGWPRRVQIMAGPVEPTKCSFHGDSLAGITCWDPANLTVHTTDKYDNSRSVGGDTVAVHCAGPPGNEPVNGFVTDHGNGTYGVDLKLTAPGRWVVSASVNGSPISAKGVAVQAAAGRMRAGDCAIMHTSGDEAVCGSTTMLTVSPFESRTGRTMQGNEAISVRVQAPSGGFRRINALLDREKDTYHSKLKWLESGPHKVFVQFGGEALPGSPLMVDCAPSDLAGITCDVVSTTGEVGALARVGEDVVFRLSARDAYGNSCPLVPDDLTVTVDPEEALMDLRVEHARGGEALAVSMAASTVCTAAVTFAVGDEASTEAAVEVHPGEACMDESEVAGGAVPDATAGKKCLVVLLARDKAGNRLVNGGGELRAYVVSSGEEVEASVADSNNGTYQVVYTVTKAGPYELVLEAPGSGTRRSYPGACVPGPASTSAARIDPKMANLAAYAGEAGWVSIRRADAHGNLLVGSLAGGGAESPLLARATGPGPADVTVSEGSDGTTKVSYEARTAGEYSLEVWDASSGESIPESPIAVHVHPGAPCAMTTVAEIESINSSQGVATVGAGAVITVRIVSKDKFGNPAPQPPDAVSVRVVGPEPVRFFGMAKALEESTPKSTFVLSGNFNAVGDYSLAALLPSFRGGEAQLEPGAEPPKEVISLRGASRIVVTPGRVHIPAVTVTAMPGRVVAGTPFDLSIAAPDQFGNLGATGGTVQAWLAFFGDDGGWKQVGEDIVCEVSLQENGEHLVRPLASARGSYKLTVQLMSGLSRAVKLAEETFTVEE